MSSPLLTVAILAGGAASRLGGRDKGLELVEGISLIARARAYCERAMVRASDFDFLIIANRHLDEYERYGRVRSDATEGFSGPLAGVASALEGARAERVLSLPVDCPSPPADLAARLLAALDATRAAAVVAHDGERRQPLFALYRRELAASAAAAAANGQGVWEWQDAIAAIEVDFADRRQQFHNLNTPEEFAAYADAVRQHASVSDPALGR